MSAPLVEDIEDFTLVLLLEQMKRILYECSSCFRYGGFT